MPRVPAVSRDLSPTAMSSDLSVDDDEHATRALPSPSGDGEFVATVVEYDQVPDECTIHPLDATDEELMTCWITALEGSFVSLPAVR